MVINNTASRSSLESSSQENAQNALQIELSAMQDIAVALGPLDELTRARVLHWAAERFRDAAVVITPPAPLYAVPRLHPSSHENQATDEGLSVSNLSDFFAPRAPKVLEEPATEAQDQSVTGMLHDFVVDFQDIVHEWNVACGSTDGREVEPVLPIVS